MGNFDLNISAAGQKLKILYTEFLARNDDIQTTIMVSEPYIKIQNTTRSMPSLAEIILLLQHSSLVS